MSATSRFVAEPGVCFDQPLVAPKGTACVRVFASENPRHAPLCDRLALVGFTGRTDSPAGRLHRNQVDLSTEGVAPPFRLQCSAAVHDRVILAVVFLP